MKNILFLAIIAAFISTSCVSSKKFEAQSILTDKYLAEKNDCEESLKLHIDLLEKTQNENSNLTNENTLLTENVNNLSKANQDLSKLAEEEKAQKDKINTAYENYMLSASKKQADLTQSLAEKERTLNKKESDLATLQKSVEDREKELKKANEKMVQKESDLTEKTKRINELESKLNEQANALTALKNNITKALKEFTSDELTVVEKEGKIYVSLSEKLLFKPGSFTLDKNGELALSKLAEVLQKQTDLDIVVEGHTDSDPFLGKGDLLDNLDLSTKRATSVTRVLIANKVAKEKITASGRGATKPIAENTTKEGKAKNRRTEIILAPNLEKLFQLIQSN